jgi:D-3-phosphoglycerate dehydrogenase
MHKVLITIGYPKEIVPNFEEEVDRLKRRGFNVSLYPKQIGITDEDLLQALQDVSIYLSGAGKVTGRVISGAGKLRLIARIGVGLEAVDIDAALKHGVAVVNCPGACSEPVAEFAVTLLLTAARRIIENDRLAHSGKWGRTIGRSVFRKTLGILGFGNIGQMLAKTVVGFDMKVIAYSRHPNMQMARALNVEIVSFEELISKSDFISLHMPHTAETEKLMNAAAFSKMKPSAILINTARGALVDEDALYHALTHNIIAGAALDVHSSEPINPASPLLKLENCILTTHNAVSTFEGRSRLMHDSVQNILDMMDGKSPAGFVNSTILNGKAFSLL